LEKGVEVLGESTTDSRSACTWLALILSKQGDLEGALRLREAALSASKQAYGPEDRRTLYDLEQVGVSLWELGKREQAEEIMEGSLAARERLFGDDDPDSQKARERLSSLRNEPH
jgi:tetratricopeptide (TPR) repeat protein